jgi:hypothetical protein
MTSTSVSRPAAPGPGGLNQVLLAEWTKSRTVRANHWTLVVSVMVTVALGATVVAGTMEEYDAMTAAERASSGPHC